jgi:hypothetical protein
MFFENFILKNCLIEFSIVLNLLLVIYLRITLKDVEVRNDNLDLSPKPRYLVSILT